MAKPATLDGYSDQYTLDCERVLVSLLRRLGPWKDSVYLVGGLTPRYLVPARPPVVPAHAGTLDVDIVIDLQILADTEAYRTLEENLRRMGFERAENDQGVKLSWRWQTRTEHGYGYPLDEALGLAPGDPCSAWVRQTAAWLAQAHPYRQAARLLSQMIGSPVDHRRLWGWVQGSGRAVRRHPRRAPVLAVRCW